MFNLQGKDANSIAAIDSLNSKITYGELVKFCQSVKHSVENRKLAFLFCQNSIETFLYYIACLENGVVPVLLDAHLDSELASKLLSTYSPQYVIASKNLNLPIRKNLVHSKGDYGIYETGEKSPILAKELALLLSTSGSTGAPKLVKLTYDNLTSNAQSIIEYLNITKDERALMNLPLNYSYGMSIINSHIFAGATVLLTESPVIQKEFWLFVREQKATSMPGVPYTYEMLKRLRFMRMELPYLKTLTQAGGKLSEALQEEFASWAQNNNKRFIVMYGQTEASPRIAYLPSEYSLQKIGYIGIPIPGGTIVLEDQNGNKIDKPFTEGELVYYGKNVSPGYACNSSDLDYTDERHGVLHTGDLAIFDEEGFYRIVGRKSQFIKVFGNRISITECENILKDKFDFDCACGGKDDLLCIYLTDETLAENAKKFLADKLGIYFKAITYIIVPEIPKTSSGKINYKELPVC